MAGNRPTHHANESVPCSSENEPEIQTTATFNYRVIHFANPFSLFGYYISALLLLLS